MIFQRTNAGARMNPAELKERTIQFAVRVLKFADALPNKPSERTIAGPVARSGCSVASNCRAALISSRRLKKLQAEAVELIKIFSATRRTARDHK